MPQRYSEEGTKQILPELPMIACVRMTFFKPMQTRRLWERATPRDYNNVIIGAAAKGGYR
jgi:hypothetical protein